MAKPDSYIAIPQHLKLETASYIAARNAGRWKEAQRLRALLPDGLIYDLADTWHDPKAIGVVLHEAGKPESASKVVLSYADVPSYEALRGYLNQATEGEPFAMGWYLIAGSKKLASGVMRSDEATVRATVILPPPGTAAEIAVTLEHLAAQVQGYLKACEESGFLGPKRQGHLGRAITDLRLAAGTADALEATRPTSPPDDDTTRTTPAPPPTPSTSPTDPE
ncbi:MAG: hypothetical protein IT477_10560 [Rhodanobacteraceae bacterium]|nr:hypothetical protein [Rhodanobacteraceae bacterium]